VILQPNVPTTVSLFGAPIEVGELELFGYSTHTLGVKSNCRLKHMMERSFPTSLKINVTAALPTIEVKTALPQLLGHSNAENVISTAHASLYNGETQHYDIEIVNTSNIPIEYMDVTLQTSFDKKTQNRMFKFDVEEVKRQLPVRAGEKLTFKLTVYGDADFIGALNSGMPSLTPHQTTDGPSSLSAMNSLSNVGNSFPSRINSPIKRNNEQSSSFRSSSTTASVPTINSGHSSLATFSLGATMLAGNHTRNFEAQLKFRYSGGAALVENYCRQGALLFNIELMPSIQITNWDVLPAETPSQFYLVLDVINLAPQELSLNYPNNKIILIESKEVVRVAVPVERVRFPLEKILPDPGRSI